MRNKIDNIAERHRLLNCILKLESEARKKSDMDSVVEPVGKALGKLIQLELLRKDTPKPQHVLEAYGTIVQSVIHFFVDQGILSPKNTSDAPKEARN